MDNSYCKITRKTKNCSNVIDSLLAGEDKKIVNNAKKGEVLNDIFVLY